jgi:chaperonin GroES
MAAIATKRKRRVKKRTKRSAATKKKAPLPNIGKITARPLDDRVIIRIDNSAEVSPGGIVLIQSAQEQSQFGTVIAVGPGLPWKENWSMDPPIWRETSPDSGSPDRLAKGPRFPMCVEVGDRVMVARFGGAPLQIDGEDYTIIREADILVVVDA